MLHVLRRYERQRLAHCSAKQGAELTCQLRDCDIDVREVAALLNANRELMARAAISRVGTERSWRGVIGVTAVLHAALVC